MQELENKKGKGLDSWKTNVEWYSELHFRELIGIGS